MGLAILQQAILLFTMDGTGDDGDSVEHYLYNKYVFDYPYLLIHSWAKPVFVLTSCLFAQLGFIGIKLFNSIMALSAAFLSYKVAKKIKIPFAELAIPILMLMPHYLHLSLSGLTEPLFSLMAVASIYLIAIHRVGWAALIISFMPFSRPEGLYFIALAGLYYLLDKKYWKVIPLLLVGHLFYTLVGVAFFDESWLWVFTKNPNAMINPAYQQTGRWLHYVRGLRFVLGIPIFSLFWIGCLAMSIPILLQLKKIKAHLIPLFILAGTFSVIVSHTIFWKFGLFKTIGLTRNLLTVAPLMSIIALAGMQSLWSIAKLQPNLKSVLSIATIVISILFLYSNSYYTVKFPQDFQMSKLQRSAQEVVQFMEKEYPRTYMTYHYYPYINMLRDQDPFEWQHHKRLFKEVIDNPLPGNAIVIWDDWFARMEGKVELEMLHNNEELEFIKSFNTIDEAGQERTFAVFKTKIWN